MNNNDNWDYEPTPEEEIAMSQDLQLRMQAIVQDHSNFVVALAAYGLLQNVTEEIVKLDNEKNNHFCKILDIALGMLLETVNRK